MEILQERPGLTAVVGVVVGIAIGLFFGWVVWPVEWTDAGPQHLSEADQARYIRLVADVFSHENNVAKVQEAFQGWPNADQAICGLAATTDNPQEQARLEAVAAIVNGQGCAAVGVEADAEEEGGGFGTILILGLLFVVLIIAILFVLNQRNAMGAEYSPQRDYEEVPEVAPVVTDEEEEVTAVPIARFRTTYTRGHDAYDDSFSIENAAGEFLGECGVGISESIGSDAPKNVTAFEVWLFDKNDIRTITKVMMSDHAFFDDALKAKLATKGEQILAREQETIVLETASLIINAEIAEMEYGEGSLPPESYFETVTFELSAWAKEGAAAGPSDMEGRIDDVLEF
jgi:uncharacterized membrane protein